MHTRRRTSHFIAVLPLDLSVDLWLSFLAGLFGSMHCVGMCGAIVVAYSTQGIPAESTRISTAAAHLSYNGGRVLSCAVVGAVLGFIGKGVSALQGAGYWFSLLVGIALVFSGLILLRAVPFLKFSETVGLDDNRRGIVARLYRASFGALVALPKLESKFYLGLLTPLLPCGLLYSMFLKAAGTGSALGGGMLMLVFGLGIVPALLLTGLASSYIGIIIRKWGERIAALTILLMGISLILRALEVPLPMMEGHRH